MNISLTNSLGKSKEMNLLLILSVVISIGGITPAFAQTIIVNTTAPCFLNQTAGIDMWRQCGADEDWVAMAILPFEWVTGGFFSLILASIIILGVYLKYHKVIYAFAVGVVFLPISFQFFPDHFMSFAVIAIFLGLTAAVLFMIRDQIRG